VATHKAAPVPASVSLVDRLAEELRRRWRAGERPIVEAYLALYPELCDQSGAAVELIYEELCLRQEYEPGTDAADVLRRFPQWRAQLEVIIACHDFLEAKPASPCFPAPGETLGTFRLLAELGRGAQGRVFLAAQPALADRPVVLKLAPRSGHEHVSLARLQHTHIVPLYSVEDDPGRNLRALCMPYFGGATLARLLDLLRGHPPGRRTGRHLLEALRQAQAATPIPVPVEGPACQFLARSSYTQVVCWMGACLADALRYTHEHGLVHLDLKPSNVLWAADGQPMLLDLHLAQGPMPAGAPAPAWLGGTPAYMAPEHRRAFTAVHEDGSVPTTVDGRADIYALGVVLCEALGGASPPPGGAAVSWLRRRNPHVTVGLADILGKCLADDPRQRYPDAAALAADLRRHLADLPLRGVANRSLMERWRKWRRRRPYAPALVGLVLAVLAGVGLALAYIGQEAHKARAALDEGRECLQRREYGPARDAYQRGLAMAEHLPFHRDLTEELRGQLRLVERAEAAQELHRFVERVRALYGADGQPTADLGRVEAHCRAFWQQRDLIVGRLDAQPVPAEREQVHHDLLDLAILWTDLRVRLAGKGEVTAVREEALEVLAQAEALFGPSCVLDGERRAHAAALGRTGEGPVTASAPRTAWELYGVGRARFREGDLEAAAAEFDQALTLEPQALWPHFYKGACAYRRGGYQDAVLAFTACTVLAPGQAWCYYNRGLAYDAMGQADRALSDYTHALECDPAFALAAVNRAMLHCQAQRYTKALEDLRQALDSGAAPALVYYDQALVHLAQGDRSAALASLEKALEHDPDHAPTRTLSDRLRRRP
jgi:serine/threonine protein kinase/Flp pilus assembly protein TadD